MTEKVTSFLQVKEKLPSIFPHELFSVGPFTYSPATMMATLALFVFIYLAFTGDEIRGIYCLIILIVFDVVSIIFKKYIPFDKYEKSSNSISFPE